MTSTTMGTTDRPRHRADVPRGARLADLRRGVARLLAGSDLYADDRELRPGAHRVDSSSDDTGWGGISEDRAAA